ncbi:ankyrin repeat-containing domain protein [Aspergillus tetrazonus]
MPPSQKKELLLSRLLALLQSAIFHRFWFYHYRHIMDNLTFLLAAATGNTTAIEQGYLSNKSILTATNPDGRTALHLAALHGHIAVIQQLITYGATLSARDSNGQTALHLAAQGSAPAPEIVGLLLQNDSGSACSIRDKNGKTAVFYAYHNPNDGVLAEFQKYAPTCGSGCALTPSIILDTGASDYFGTDAQVQASASSGRRRAPTERTAIKS